MPIDITKPDNGADTVITLIVSGNRLVSVLNAVQSLMYQHGHLVLKGDDAVAANSWWQELHETVERMRDQLSDQRCARSKANTSCRNLTD